VTELLAEFSSSAYMTDTKLSRFKRIPRYTGQTHVIEECPGEEISDDS